VNLCSPEGETVPASIVASVVLLWLQSQRYVMNVERPGLWFQQTEHTWLSLCKIVRSSVILLLPLFCILMFLIKLCLIIEKTDFVLFIHGEFVHWTIIYHLCWGCWIQSLFCFASSRMIQNMQCQPLTWFYVTKHFIEYKIRVITKLPNSEQSYKGKVKNHKCINRENQSTTGKLWQP
jgi:hypothetical protein